MKLRKLLYIIDRGAGMSLKLTALPTGLMDIISVGDGWNSDGAFLEAESVYI